MQENEIERSQSQLWTFDPTRLVPGDVLLERGKGSISKFIAAIDRGKYSHALIWVGETDFVESVGLGSRSISYARFLISDPDRWLLLRLTADTEAAARAAVEARNLVFKSYDLRGAINTKLNLPRAEDSTQIFCSQLVAEAYSRAGVVLVKGKRPAEITPNMLRRNSILKESRPPLLSLPLSDDVECAEAEQFSDRDSAYEKSPMAKELCASQEAFAVVRPMLDDVALPHDHLSPGNLNELFLVLPAIDAMTAEKIGGRLLEELESRGYFDFLEEPAREIGYRIVVDCARVRIGAVSEQMLGQLLMHTEQQVEQYSKGQVRHAKNAETCQQIAAASSLPLWTRLVEMYFWNASLMGFLANKSSELCDEIRAAQSKS